LVSGSAFAGLIYSNDFAGTEFKAIGVGDTSTYRAGTTNGVLNATVSDVSAGWKVDLNSLNLDTVEAVRIDAVMRAPTNNTWIGFGFSDGGGYNLSASGGGKPWLALLGTGIARVYGGEGATNVTQANTAVPLSPAVFDVSFTYYISGVNAGKADVVVNGANVWTKQALTFTPAGLPALNYAHIHLRGMDTAANGGGYVDSFSVTAIPEPTTVGLFSIASGLVLVARHCLMR
jgi:hypothetical protein